MRLTAPIFSIAHRREIVAESAAATRRAQARCVRVVAHLRHERRLAEAHALVVELRRSLRSRFSSADSAALGLARDVLRYVQEEEGPSMLAAAERTARAIEDGDVARALGSDGEAPAADGHMANGTAARAGAARGGR